MATNLSDQWWAPGAALLSPLPAGALSNFITPGRRPVPVYGAEPPGPVEQFLPGAVTSTWAGVSGLGQVLDKATGGRVGWNPLPGGERAAQLSDMSYGNAREIVGNVLPDFEPNPNDPTQMTMSRVGRAVGEVLTPLPLAKAPRAAQFVGNALLPGATGTSKVAGLTGGIVLGADTLLNGSEGDDIKSLPVPGDDGIRELPVPAQVQATKASFSGESIPDKVTRYAMAHQVPVPLAHAMAKQESNYNPAARSPAGAVGVMQLMPATAKALGVTDLNDVDQNIDAGMRYIKEAMGREKTVEGVARYYHGGPDRNIWGPKTEQHARVIAANYNSFGGQQAQAQQLPPLDRLEPDLEKLDSDGWTYMDVGKAALAGLAVALGGSSGLKIVRDGRAAKIKEAADAEWLSDRAARDAGQSPPGPIPSVVTGKEGPLSSIQTAVQDSAKPIYNVIDTVIGSDTIARSLRAKTGMISNHVAEDGRFRSFAETGYDPTTGIRMPSMLTHYENVQGLPTDKATKYHRTINALDEEDNRLLNFQKAQQAGQLVPDEQLRVNFPRTDSTELRQIIADGLADPDVRKLVDTRKIINARFSEWLEKMGFVSAAERTRVDKAHPNYLASTDKDGRVLHTFGTRDLTPWSGREDIDLPTHMADDQHWHLNWKEAQRNTLKNELFEHIYRYQQDPTKAKILEPDTGPPAGMSPGDWITNARTRNVISWRRNGVLEWHKVNDPNLYHALEQDVTTVGTMLGVANRIKNAYTSATTGAASLLVGNAFAIRAAGYNAAMGSIVRPKGTSTGLIDATVRKATGGAFGLPGDIVGTLTGQSYAVIADAASHTAGKLARLLSPESNNASNRYLRTLLGDQVVDAISTRAQNTYISSVLHQRRSEGLANIAGQASTDLPTPIAGAKGKNIYSPIGAMAGRLTDIPILRQGQQVYFSIRNLARDIHDIIGDSTSSHFYRLNTGQFPGMSWAKSNLAPDVLKYETRNLLGDPGKRGSSKAMQTATDTIPYLNVTLQGTARFAQAIKDNPIGTMTGVMQVLGMGAFATLLTAVHRGPDAFDYLDRLATLDQTAGDIVLFSGPDTPVEQMTILKLPQELRMFFPVVMQMVRDVFAVQDVFRDADTYDSFMEAVSQFLGKHISPRTRDATVAGAASALSITTPPLMQATVNLTGKAMPNIDLQRIMGADTPSQALTMPIQGGTPRAPGMDEGLDPTFKSEWGMVAKGMIESTLGIAGAFMMDALSTGMDSMRWGKSGPEIVSNVVDLWKQNALDRTTGASALWPNNIELKKSTPLAEQVYKKLNAIKPMMTAEGDLSNQGLTRAEGMPVQMPPGSTKLPTDPQKLALWMIGGEYAKEITNILMPRVHDIDKLIFAAEHSGNSPFMIRQERNKLVRQREAALANVADILTRMEGAMSRFAGQPIVIEDVDWGPTQ